MRPPALIQPSRPAFPIARKAQTSFPFYVGETSEVVDTAAVSRRLGSRLELVVNATS